MINFLEQKVWDSGHPAVWKQIVSRWGQADYDDQTKRKDHQNTLKAEYDAKSYQRDRQYPDLGEQLDMQYWDQVNGTTTWKDAVAKVKADNPKP